MLPSKSAPKDNKPIPRIKVKLGQTARLPCSDLILYDDGSSPSHHMASNQQSTSSQVINGDPVQLILWYKTPNATGPPIYTIDARSSSSIFSGVHFTASVPSSASSTSLTADHHHLLSLKERTYFNLTTRPNPVLIISDVTYDDQSDYSCRVDYKWRRTIISPIGLSVLIKPKVVIIQNDTSSRFLNQYFGTSFSSSHQSSDHSLRKSSSPKSQFKPTNGISSKSITGSTNELTIGYGIEGNETIINCLITSANPAVSEILWIFNGSFLDPNPKSQISNHGIRIKNHFDQHNSGSFSILTIERTEKKHSGLFQCIAKNTEGTSQSSGFQLRILSRPEPVTGCKIIQHNQTSVPSSDSMMISCLPGYDGGVNQSYHLQAFDDPQNNVIFNTSRSDYPRFLITKLKPETVYVLIIYSSNPFGSSPKYSLKSSTAPLQSKHNQKSNNNKWRSQKSGESTFDLLRIY